MKQEVKAEFQAVNNIKPAVIAWYEGGKQGLSPVTSSADRNYTMAPPGGNHCVIFETPSATKNAGAS
jgi:hypothetical protein